MSETPDEGAEGVEAPLDFDPYRFGAPEHPVPPEYAPPGYVPPPSAIPPPPQPNTAYPGTYPPPPGQPQQPYPPQGYPPPGYPPPGYPPPGYPPPGYQPGVGYPPAPPNYSAQYPQPRTGNGRATAGLVLGVASILLCWTVIFDLIPITLGFVFSSLGRRAATRDPRLGGKGVALAGIICSAVGTVLAIVLAVIVFRAAAACNDFNQNSSQFRDCVQHYLHLK